MSDAPIVGPRPVSLVTILAIFASFALFLAIVYAAYVRHRTPAPQDVAAEKSPADLAWKATPEGRKAYLLDLRARQQKEATNYAWIDRKAGIIQVPIKRAMALVVDQYGSKRPSPFSK